MLKQEISNKKSTLLKIIDSVWGKFFIFESSEGKLMKNTPEYDGRSVEKYIKTLLDHWKFLNLVFHGWSKENCLKSMKNNLIKCLLGPKIGHFKSI